MKQCKMCRERLTGRRDKIFCDIYCKNDYHAKLRSVTAEATLQIDNILHRNRSILLEIMGKRSTKKKISRLFLDDKNFNFDFVTGYHINIKKKHVNHVYDFSWLIFSDEEVLITRKR